MRMYTEAGEVPSHIKQPRLGQHISSVHMSVMSGNGRESTPPGDRVSSAADAMLKLSNTQPTQHQSYPGLSSEESPATTYRDPSEYDSEDSVSIGGVKGVFSRQSRKQRQFIPDNKKDEQYWSKRKKNNEAAKRSREKRRMNDMKMGHQVMELTKINTDLTRELHALKKKFGLPLDEVFVDENGCDDSFQDSASPSGCHVKHDGMTSVDGLSLQRGQPAFPSPVPTATVAAGMLLPSTPQPTQADHHQQPVTIGSKAKYPPPLMPIGEGLLYKAQNCAPADTGSSQRNMVHITHNSSTTSFPSQSSAQPQPQPQQYNARPDILDSYQHMAAPLHNPISPTCSAGGSTSSSPAPLKISLTDDSHNEESSSEENGQALQMDTEDSPLNLSKKSEDDVSTESMVNGCPTQSANGTQRRRQMRKGMPLKLWHKVVTMSDEHEDVSQAAAASAALQYNTALSEADILKEDYPPTLLETEIAQRSLDPTYIQRRSRNNQAAKKCRENRRMINEIRVVQSNALESENVKLKEELKSLSNEVSNLKDLLEKKKKAEAKGEQFEPPPLEHVLQTCDKDS